jgi:hypothetical protein
MLVITTKKGNTLNSHRLGRVRSEIEANLQKEWGTSSWDEERVDKAKFIEKKTEMKEGFIPTKAVDRVK